MKQKKPNQKEGNNDINTKNNNNNNSKIFLYNMSSEHIANGNQNIYKNLKNKNILRPNLKNIDINNIDKKMKNQNENNKINSYNNEKTIFSKITEDLYINNMDNSKQKGNIIYLFDPTNFKEDNYNKLTVENYLYNCADKENSKNGKIIKEFIERKNKEQRFKKIGIDLEKFCKNSQYDNFKRLSNDCNNTKRTKSSRSPDQFLEDQKNLEEKHKNYINNLIKIHDKEISQCMKDRPTITKESERLASINKILNKSVHLKLYEEFHNKYQKERSNILLKKINLESIGNIKIVSETILENSKRLYKEYEKKKNFINENEINQLKNIKNLSTISFIDKRSNCIISKKFMNNYKNELKTTFNKNITENFDINFMDYLLFIYKIGLTEKNYNQIINYNKNVNNLIINNFDKNYKNEIDENQNNNLLSNRKKYKDENFQKINKNSQKIIKINTYTKS